jgi:hypothetical protein
MKLKTFTIIERKWARGGKGGASMLRNNSGHKCCLGFLAQAAGAQKITGAYYPHHMMDCEVVLPRLATMTGHLLSRRIARINDCERLTDADRKKRLAPLFRKIGWKPLYE